MIIALRTTLLSALYLSLGSYGMAQFGRVALSPDPVRDTLEVRLDGFLGYRLEVLSNQGRVVFRARGSGPVQRINMRGQSPGKYFLRVYATGESLSESFPFKFEPITSLH